MDRRFDHVTYWMPYTDHVTYWMLYTYSSFSRTRMRNLPVKSSVSQISERNNEISSSLNLQWIEINQSKP